MNEYLQDGERKSRESFINIYLTIPRLEIIIGALTNITSRMMMMMIKFEMNLSFDQ